MNPFLSQLNFCLEHLFVCLIRPSPKYSFGVCCKTYVASRKGSVYHQLFTAPGGPLFGRLGLFFLGRGHGLRCSVCLHLLCIRICSVQSASPRVHRYPSHPSFGSFIFVQRAQKSQRFLDCLVSLFKASFNKYCASPFIQFLGNC